jgi:hypothetical protein
MSVSVVEVADELGGKVALAMFRAWLAAHGLWLMLDFSCPITPRSIIRGAERISIFMNCNSRRRASYRATATLRFNVVNDRLIDWSERRKWRTATVRLPFSTTARNPRSAKPWPFYRISRKSICIGVDCLARQHTLRPALQSIRKDSVNSNRRAILIAGLAA